MKQYFLIFMLSILGAIPVVAQGEANCGCDSEMDLDAHIEAANVIIYGQCLRVASNPIKGGLNVVFHVDSSWKRGIEHTATVHTNSVGQCGYGFKKGDYYLVFARKRHQTIETTICEPNFHAKHEQASLIMEKLGVGFSPGRPEMAWNMSLLVLGLGVLGLLFIALVVFRKKFTRKKSS